MIIYYLQQLLSIQTGYLNTDKRFSSFYLFTDVNCLNILK